MANSVKSTPSSFEVVLLPRFFNYPQVHKNWTSPHQPREGLIAWGILSCLPAEIIPTIIGASHARPLSGEKHAISWAQKAVGKTASPKVLQRRACARPKHQPRLLHKVLVNFALVSLALLVKPRSSREFCVLVVESTCLMLVGEDVVHLAPYIGPAKKVTGTKIIATLMNNPCECFC